MMTNLRGSSKTVKFIFFKNSRSGLTLLEIIIVIALMAGMMIYAMPGITDSKDYITRINLIASDIKNAYDTSVLTGKPYRLVFDFSSKQYWIETTTATDFRISRDPSGRDLNDEQAKEKKEMFELEFEEYVELAGREVTDPDSGEPIKPDSPLMRAKSKLIDPPWFEVGGVEWPKRSIGPDLAFAVIQTEHLDEPINGFEEDKGTVAHLYFFPTGYVEKAFILIRAVDNADQIIEEEEPFTVETFPYEGIAIVTDGEKEMKFDNTY